MRKITLTSIIAIMLVPFCALAEVPIELLSHIGGYDGWLDPSIAWSVAVDGDLACVGMANCFLLIDISKLSAPAQLSRVDFEVGEVVGSYFQGDYLYTASNYGLHIIDVSNPRKPQILGSCSTDFGCDVVVSGDYAYLADGDECLRVIDISNPNEPNIVGSWKPDSPNVFAEHIDFQDGIAYVSDEHYKKLYIIDVTEPDAPVEFSTYESNDYTHGICVRGDYAYLANSTSGLNIIDISNPNEPNSIAVCDTPGNAYGVAIVEIPLWPGGPIESYACVTNSYGGLNVINVTWPESPYPISSYPTGMYSYRLDAQDSYAFVANSETGIDIIDLSEVDLGVLPLAGRFAMSQAAHHVSIVGSIACLTDEYTGLNLFDISNPSAPACLGGYDPYVPSPGHTDYYNVTAAVIKDNVAFVGYIVEMEPIDITDPVNPSPSLCPCWLGGQASEMLIEGDMLYATTLEGGLCSFYIPGVALCPPDMGKYDTDYTARDLAVNANVAYIADDIGGLIILDVNDPEHFSAMGSFDTNGIAYGVDVAGSHAVVADYNDGLKTIDISDPCNPVQVGSVGTSNYAADVTVAGSLAFITDGDSGLQVASIKDPCSPSIIAGLDFEGFAKRIDNNGKIAIIAAEEGGFYIVRIGEPADLEPDGDIDVYDLLTLMQQWMDACEKPYGCSNADINNDTIVNFADFAELAAQWQ